MTKLVRRCVLTLVIGKIESRDGVHNIEENSVSGDVCLDGNTVRARIGARKWC